jgi:hypothetical protein
VSQPQQFAAFVVCDAGYRAGVKQVDIGSLMGVNYLETRVEELASQ